MTKRTDLSEQETALIENAGIVAAIVGTVALLLACIDLAENEVSWTRIGAIFLGVFSFTPFVAGIAIDIKRAGLRSAFSRWSITLVTLAGVGMLLFVLLLLVGTWPLAAFTFLVVVVILFRRWKFQIKE